MIFGEKKTGLDTEMTQQAETTPQRRQGTVYPKVFKTLLMITLHRKEQGHPQP